MPVTPSVNGGVTPPVRRPRLTIAEGVAISGPFELRLFASDAVMVNPYRPAPNDITVLSDRIAITATAEAPVGPFPWGVSYPVAVAVPSTGVLVGYLWFKSVDADADGYDDLESGGSITLDCVSTFGDGLVDAGGNPMAGTGALSLTGTGTMTADNPLAGIGSLALTASGTFAVVGTFAGSGLLNLSGAGTMVADNPLAGVGAMNLGGVGAMVVDVASSTPTRLYWPQTSGSQLNATDNVSQYTLWDVYGYPIGDRWCWLRIGTGGTWSLVKQLQQDVLSEDLLIKTLTAVGGETQIQLGISTTASAPASASFVANFPAALVAGDVIDAKLTYIRGSDGGESDWYRVAAAGAGTPEPFNYVDINY